MKASVYVNSIVKGPLGTGIVAEASNGTEDGPPFVRWSLPPDDVVHCYIGKRYSVEIKDE